MDELNDNELTVMAYRVNFLAAIDANQWIEQLGLTPLERMFVDHMLPRIAEMLNSEYEDWGGETAMRDLALRAIAAWMLQFMESCDKHTTLLCQQKIDQQIKGNIN